MKRCAELKERKKENEELQPYMFSRFILIGRFRPTKTRSNFLVLEVKEV